MPTWHRKNSESGNPRCRASFGIGVAVLHLRSDGLCQLGRERIRRATEAPRLRRPKPFIWEQQPALYASDRLLESSRRTSSIVVTMHRRCLVAASQPSQPSQPVPVLFEHPFSAKMQNGVLKNMPKLNLRKSGGIVDFSPDSRRFLHLRLERMH